VKNHLFFLLFFVLPTLSWSQHGVLTEDSLLDESHRSNTLLQSFKNGVFHGHFRYFFMATDNAPGLTDYFANAGGGGVRYESGSFHGFHFGAGGFFIFNLGSSDLGKADPTTNQSNRYEIGLFDINDPYNHKDIDRLEEFYIRYGWKDSKVIFGRQVISTPFINPQDGRMRPTGEEGLWFEMNDIKNLSLQGGWLYAISPRGTTHWYDIGHSLSLNPPGVDQNGIKSKYPLHIESNGIFLLGAKYKLGKKWNVQLWDQYVENIFNSSFAQLDFKSKLNDRLEWFASGQSVLQHAVENGGAEEDEFSYTKAKSKALTFGGRLGLKSKRLTVSLNYNRVTNLGRYNMPREWGRDPFFTFLPRERSEGYADVHAFVIKTEYQSRIEHLKFTLGGGYVKMPDVFDFANNKYGLPSYAQVNGEMKYAFGGKLKGFDVHLLLANKIGIGDTHNNNKYVFNKVNVMLYNMVLNFHF
jgi:hypothetical protein